MLCLYIDSPLMLKCLVPRASMTSTVAHSHESAGSSTLKLTWNLASSLWSTAMSVLVPTVHSARSCMPNNETNTNMRRMEKTPPRYVPSASSLGIFA